MFFLIIKQYAIAWCSCVLALDIGMDDNQLASLSVQLSDTFIYRSLYMHVFAWMNKFYWPYVLFCLPIVKFIVPASS